MSIHSPSKRYRIITLAVLSLLGGLALSAGFLDRSLAADAAAIPLNQGDFAQEPALPLIEKTERSEPQGEQLEALALFASARALEQSEDYAGALRLYQRALRHDPDSLPIVQEIVQLAFNLGRPAEGVRYALKAIDLGAGDPVLLRRLAMHLTSQGDFAAALKLYERALSQHDSDATTPTVIGLHSEMGELFLANGQFREAADAFARVFAVVQKTGDGSLDRRARRQLLGQEPAESYRRFGQAFLLDERFDDAITAFRKANEIKADEPQLAYDLATVAAKRKQPEEALTQLDKVFASGGDRLGTGAYELLSQQLAALNRAEELIPRLEKLRTADADNVLLGYYLAQQYVAAEQFDNAEPLFKTLLEKQPVAEGFQGLLKIARMKKDAPRVVEVLGDCGKHGGRLSVLEEETDALVADPEFLKQVFEAARKRAADPPEDNAKNTNAASQLLVALLAVEAEDWEAAKEFFEAAIKSEPSQAVAVYLQWGFSLLLANEYREAAEVFQRAVEDSNVPHDEPDFYYHLAGAREMTGQTEEALVAARKAVELAEAHAEQLGDRVFRLYPRVAWVLYHSKRYDEAYKEYEQLVKRFDTVRTSSEARDVVREARFALSNICVVRRDIPQAEEWLQQILDEYPEDVGAYNDLGYLWADQGKNLDRALEMIKAAVEEQPENIAYRDSLGWVLFKLERFEDAAQELERAVSLDDDPDGVILNHLGDSYLKLGRGNQAREVFQRAMTAAEKKGDTQLIESLKAKLAAPE